ncbi:hypothetical protein Dsin_030067 [Dipteronia sinensis]|uniref:Myb-like protein X n=1 Tax=Dipteronia sinensis TaxID=43782 RepID=A0AAD9ZHZ4_9ROSI|nr:hypothetical protein Dsin_030067 [Dipteronia sinensis]
MSRCFPFPPPGYEKKATIEDKDLLTKETQKDKKHKKDKKDKEKKEGKEKKDRDKERSKEKNRDKNVRKEKHKDKKDRDKDKDKDKEKNCTSDAKKFEGQPECYNGEKLGSNCLQNKEIKDFKFMQDLARRIKDGGGAMGSQIDQKIIVTNQRGGKLPGRLVERGIDSRLEEKEKAKDKKVNGQNHVEARGLQNAIVQGFSGTDKKVFQGIVKPVENNDIWKQVEKEKIKHKESDSKDDKYKDKDREKKSRSKDKDREKERKEEEKTKEIRESNKDLLKLDDNGPKFKESGKDFFNSGNIKPPDTIKMSSNSSVGDGSLGKRKELEINGILHDNGIRPNKLPRPVSSALPVMENGRKPAIHFASEQGAADNHKVDTKERKINGLMEVPQPSVCSTRPLSTIVQVSENGEASLKQPHPDSKYLNQILSLPKVEDWSDLDDQEWLFSGNSLQSKKSKVGSPRVDGTQVWAEALRIETDDLIALPYVIPY